MVIAAGHIIQASDLSWLADSHRIQVVSDPGGDSTDSSTFVPLPTTTHSIPVPAWAVRAIVDTTLNSFLPSGSPGGQMVVSFGGQQGSVVVMGANVSTGARDSYSTTDQFDVTAVAGTNVTVSTLVRRSGGTGRIEARLRTFRIEFLPS